MIHDNGEANTSENSINKLVGILFGPQAFDDFISFIMSMISIRVQGVKKMLLSFEFFKYFEKLSFALGILASIDVPIFTKKLFKDSAILMLDNFSSFL